MSKNDFLSIVLGATLLCGVAQGADHPGTKHLILPADMPKPYLTPARPKNAIPEAPKGFSVTLFAT